MKNIVDKFPDHLLESLDISLGVDLSSISKIRYDNVVIVGMGGSGVSGRIVELFVKEHANVSITVIQNYTIPNFINSKTLAICCSYSGNTEETLSAFEGITKREAKMITMSSGGKLSQASKTSGAIHIPLPKGLPPRGALGYVIVQLINILICNGVICSTILRQIISCKEFLNSNNTEILIRAQKLARFLHEKNVGIYTVPELEAIAIRGRQQFNENAKVLIRHHIIPEMNHNELVGWANADDRQAVLFLETRFTHERNKKRVEITKKLLEQYTTDIFSLTAVGSNLIEESLYLMHILDYASCYLAELYDQDPIEVNIIQSLKRDMALQG